MSQIPVGTIMMWGGTGENQSYKADGWLMCDGTPVSQTKYAALYAAIGNNFGGSPPAGQFYLPDLRGRFIRGVDGGSGNDPDAGSRTDMKNPKISQKGIGSIQNDAFKKHSHSRNMFTQSADDGDYTHWAWNQDGSNNQSSSVGDSDFETRPKNAALYYIIKAV